MISSFVGDSSRTHPGLVALDAYAGHPTVLMSLLARRLAAMELRLDGHSSKKCTVLALLGLLWRSAIENNH